MTRCFLALLTMLSATPLFAQDAPLPARVAAQKMTLPPGFKATLFAGEPDVVQPIAFCFDDRGRMWVAECLSYPNWVSDPKLGKDRIIILEDTDGDGVHDKRTVFANNIQNLSGIQYGFGGVWLCATPNLLFIPIKDDKPAGPPQVVLDGWDLKARHNVFNSPTWGPDGWLYGCNGILSNSRVGAPGTPDKDRVQMNCGVWRYHPTKKKFEAVAHGTTNPWGLDFDEHGEMFITNCVIDHLWHIVPGGHYQRMFGNDLNPHVYKLMPSICDHLHWGGGSWTSSRAPLKRAGSVSDGTAPVANASGSYAVHSEAGGGHAHVGCMIYLGDNWPARYRGGVFMCNLHGNRINHDILERNGSTYVARHAKDFMHANDPWFRGLAIHYGPDGGVYVSDWTDTGECHNYKVADKTNGRIFKITYGKVKPWKGDLAKLDDRTLLFLHLHKNQWFVRHARRILQERAAKNELDVRTIPDLKDQTFIFGRSIQAQVEALWTLNCVSGIDERWLTERMQHAEDTIRICGIRILMDRPPTTENAKVLTLHASARSPRVRLYVAAALQRFEIAHTLPVRYSLLSSDDASDPMLPLMIWYGLSPLASNVPHEAITALGMSRMPLVREHLSRRLTEEGKFDQLLDKLHEWGENPPFHRDILRGIGTALNGRREVVAPKAWKVAYPDLIESPLPEVRERALALAVQFGDERAFTLLRKIVPDRAQPFKERETALKTLLFQQKADLVPVLQNLLRDESLRGAAIRGLAAYDDAKTPALLLQGYAKWNAEEKADAIQTLAARGKFALALLDAIDAKTIPRGDINSYTIRQLQALKSPEVAKKLAKVWGEVRPASADKAKLMAKYKSQLTPSFLKKADLANGRALYVKNCANCHRLFGEGGAIGPDLTGSQRMNLDYVLENILDPSAIVPREFQVTLVETKQGRTLSGIVKKENDASITLQLQNELVIVPKADIDTRAATKLSMMPEGAFDKMRLEEVRDLLAYLHSPEQVALKK